MIWCFRVGSKRPRKGHVFSTSSNIGSGQVIAILNLDFTSNCIIYLVLVLWRCLPLQQPIFSSWLGLKWQPPSSRHSRPTISDKEKRTAKGYDVSFELYARDCRERERELTQKHVKYTMHARFLSTNRGARLQLSALSVLFSLW